MQTAKRKCSKKAVGADYLFYLGMSQLQARQRTEARGVLSQALAGGLQEPFATEANVPSQTSSGSELHEAP